MPPADLICIDLDTRSIYMTETKRHLNIKLVPKKAYKNLKKQLEAIALKVNLKMLEMKKDKPSISFNQLTKTLENQFAIEIQEAFLQFMTLILKDFRSYLMPIKKQPSIGSTDPNSLFDFKEFIMSRDKNYHQFYTLLMNTQMFTRFIEERTFFSDKYTSLAFFDECLNRIESTENVDFSTFQLIELDDRDKNLRTTFISDPESLLSSADYKQAYKYNKFGPLNHDLFLKEPILSHFETYRKSSVDSRLFDNSLSGNLKDRESISNLNLYQQNTTSSSPMMMKRTKHEVRSAQRIAKQSAETPLTWSKCLISYCYSIWFVHLHSYVRANQQLPLKAKLKIAFNVLLRMQSLDLHPLDEVCYRILMLLAGIYSQPVLAVQILHEMKKNNVTANAITYGFYSKAVLESDWKTNEEDLTDASLHWKRLRNLIDCTAELRRSGRRFAKRRFKEGNSLLNYNLINSSGNLNNTNDLSTTFSTFDKHDTLFNRQHSKSSSFREKKLNKNRLIFNEELAQKSSIIKDDSINQFNNLNNHSSEAGLLINSHTYLLNTNNKKKQFDRKRHKSEEQSDQSSFNLNKIKEELLNASINLSSSNLTTILITKSKNLPRSQSLSVYKYQRQQQQQTNNLNNDLSNYKRILEQQHTRTPSTASSQIEHDNNQANLIDLARNKLIDKKSEQSINCSDEHIDDEKNNKNLQSTESLDSENSTFSPLKDAIKSINPFFSENKVASTLRSSFRFAKSFSKNQFASSSLFRTSLTRQSSSIETNASNENNNGKNLKLKDSQQANGNLSTESLEVVNNKELTNKELTKKELNEIKCNKMTRSSTLPLSISSAASNDSETALKQSNLSIENELNNTSTTKNETTLTNETSMAKSHSSTDFSSIWSTKLNYANKHMDYLNSFTSKFATNTMNRLNEIKSKALSSNHNSPSKANSNGQSSSSNQNNNTTNQNNNSALFTNLGQNTSALFTNIASMVADKLPANVGPFSEFYEYYMYNTDWPDSNTDSTTTKQSESFTSDKFFETLEQQYGLNNDNLNAPTETTILNIEITSCSKCYNCLAILYDEEIMGEWSPDDSNLNTTCRYCEKLFVPKLTIKIKYNSKFNYKNLNDCKLNSRMPDEDSELFEDYKKFSLAYLSPIVLRKEIENIVDNEGDFCLTNCQFTLDHDIIFWNLVWYFKRVNLPTHLSGIYLSQFLKEKYGDNNQFEENLNLDFRNVNIVCLWDNDEMFVDTPKPM